MIECNKIFLDTTPIIYFLDEDANFGEKVRNIFEEIILSGKKMLSSVITCEEYLVYPYKTGNQEKIDVFFEFTEDCDITLCDVNLKIAKKAAQIRARYTDFKAMDSLQLAMACEIGCDLFLTNDKQLRRFKELRCVTVEDWQ